MADIRFGTDGWRALIAQDFTFENVRRVSQAIADYLKLSAVSRQPAAVIVGYDRRFLSQEYAKICCEILAANNINVLYVNKPTPTPAVTLSIKKRGLCGAVIITASHNPPYFNGMKFKTKDATPADETVTKEIEKLIPDAAPTSIAFNEAIKNKLINMVDIDNDYLNFIKTYIDLTIIKKTKPSLLIDYMHGVGAGYVEKLLEVTKCKITAIRAQRDPLFGGVNPEPVPKNLQEFLKLSNKEKPDLAIALDGDADRIAACGPDGEYLSSGQIISLILLHLLEYRRLKGKVIKTISGINLIEKIAKNFNLNVEETPVGFKHISRIMLHEDVLIGGEESGGIGVKGYIPERDGIVSGLLLLEMVAARKKPIHKIMQDVYKKYGKSYYDRLDLKLAVEKGQKLVDMLRKNPPAELAKEEVAEIKSYDGIKFILKNDSWLLIRASGTEPIIRIYAEAKTKQGLKALLDTGRNLVAKWN